MQSGFSLACALTCALARVWCMVDGIRHVVDGALSIA